MKKLKNSFTILNKKGLHARPSTELVKCAQKYKSEIYLNCHGQTVSAKSVLDLLLLAAQSGEKIEIEAEGVDAKEAIEAIKRLAQSHFNINY